MLTESFEQTAEDDFNDTILPAQYYPTRRKISEAEYRLLVAVLEDAVRSYLENRNAKTWSQQIEFSEAQQWLYTSGETEPFAFESICEALDIDAEAIRKHLKSLGQRALPRRRLTSVSGIQASAHARRSRRGAHH